MFLSMLVNKIPLQYQAYLLYGSSILMYGSFIITAVESFLVWRKVKRTPVAFESTRIGNSSNNNLTVITNFYNSSKQICLTCRNGNRDAVIVKLNSRCRNINPKVAKTIIVGLNIISRSNARLPRSIIHIRSNTRSRWERAKRAYCFCLLDSCWI